MELDDLRSAWQSLDRKLDRHYAIELKSLRELKLGKIRQHLRLLTVGRVIQLLAGATLTLVMANFWIGHMQQPPLFICGVLLHLYGLLLITSSAREFYLINAVDYAAPVLAIQRKLAELRKWHVTEAVVFGMTGCAIWVPMVLVTFQMLFGVDLYTDAPAVVWAFVLSTVILVALVLVVWRWTRAPGRANIARRITDHLVGKTMVQAESVLGELSRFEEDS